MASCEKLRHENDVTFEGQILIFVKMTSVLHVKKMLSVRVNHETSAGLELAVRLKPPIEAN